MKALLAAICIGHTIPLPTGSSCGEMQTWDPRVACVPNQVTGSIVAVRVEPCPDSIEQIPSEAGAMK